MAHQQTNSQQKTPKANGAAVPAAAAAAAAAATENAPILPGTEGESIRAIFRDAFKGHDGVPGDGDAGENAESKAGAAGDGGSETSKGTVPKNLAALAERLGVKVEELYEIEYSEAAGDGSRSRKLGELKDVLAKTDDLDAEELKFHEKRVKSENEVLRAREELAYVLEHLPKSQVTESLKQRAAAERDRVEKVERARTLRAIPEWTDEETEQADKDGMAEFMAGYGFHTTDVDRVNDHRLLKLLRDSWQRAERVRIALEKMTEQTAGGAKPAASSASARPNSNGSAPRGNKAEAKKSLRRELGKILRG